MLLNVPNGEKKLWHVAHDRFAHELTGKESS